MQFKIKVKDLRSALDRIHTIPGTMTLAAQLVRIEAGLEGITLARRSDASDVLVEVEAATTVEGLSDVGYDKIQQIIQQLPGEEVEVTAREDDLVFVSGPMRSSVALIREEEFIEDSSDDLSEHSMLVPIEDLVSWFKALLPGASTDDARPNIKGIIAGGRDFELAATDGTILLLINPDVQVLMPPTLIPTPVVNSIIRFFAGQKGRVEVEFSEHSILLQMVSMRFRASLSAEKTPNYDALTTQVFEILGTVERSDLHKALKAGEPLCAGIGKNPIELTAVDDQIQLFGRSGTTDFHYVIDATCDNRTGVVIASSTQLLKAIEFMQEKHVQLRINDQLISAQEDGRSFFNCLMRIEPQKRKG